LGRELDFSIKVYVENQYIKVGFRVGISFGIKALPVFTPFPPKARIHKMKKVIFIIAAGIALLSCSRKDVSAPGAANQNFFYKDDNIAVQDIQASQTESGTITVNFSTAYEKNIHRIELMSGVTTNSFCTTQGTNTTGNSTSVKNYSFQDSNLKGSTMYYMLRFENDLGQWSYSGYYSVQVN